jgi:hypothetical protein
MVDGISYTNNISTKTKELIQMNNDSNAIKH